MINNTSRTISLPSSSYYSSSSSSSLSPPPEFLHHSDGVLFPPADGGGWERELMTSIILLDRQSDDHVKRQQQHRIESDQGGRGGGGGYLSNFDHCFVLDSELNGILSRSVKAEPEPEIARFVAAGVMNRSTETTTSINEAISSCQPPPPAGGEGVACPFKLQKENVKKRKTTEDKPLVPPLIKTGEEENEDYEVKKKARQQKLTKNADDQKLLSSSSRQINSNMEKKNNNGEEDVVVSGCTISEQNNNNKFNSKNQKPTDDYIHVRARRGQATDSHSLAERVRREKISERMKYLQNLVPGCNKITGKAGMLDEIINYVQSLQRQVEFLSMKLAIVNPRLIDDDYHFLPKETIMTNDTGLNDHAQFEMVMMNEALDHHHHHHHHNMGILRRTISAPVTLPLPNATHHNLDLCYLTEVQNNSCYLSWDNSADLLQSFYNNIEEEFHPERPHQQHEGDYFRLEI